MYKMMRLLLWLPILVPLLAMGQGMTLGFSAAIGPQVQVGAMKLQGKAREYFETVREERTMGSTWQMGMNLNILLPGNWWLQPEFFYTQAKDQFSFYTTQRLVDGTAITQQHIQDNKYTYSEIAILFKWRPYWRSRVLPYYLFGPYVEQGSGSGQPRLIRTEGPDSPGESVFPIFANDAQNPIRLGLIGGAGAQWMLKRKKLSLNMELRTQMSGLTTFRRDDGANLLFIPNMQQEVGEDPLKLNLRPLKVLALVGINFHWDCY